MFCTHNEVDLRIGLTRRKDKDFVVIRCRACRRHLGTPFPLFDLVETAIKRTNATREALEEEKRRLQEGTKEDSEEE